MDIRDLASREIRLLNPHGSSGQPLRRPPNCDGVERA